MLNKVIKLIDYLYISFYSMIFFISCFTIFTYTTLEEIPLNSLEWSILILVSVLIICSALGIVLVLSSMTKKTRIDSYYFAWFALVILLILTVTKSYFLLSHYGIQSLLTYIDFHLTICFALVFRIAFLKLFIEEGI